MRKSEASSKQISGNVNKYESYREAWSRIKLALENQFFLEAITIQESIISDRLLSFLSRPGAPNPFILKNGSFPSFGKLIKGWRAEFKDGIPSASYPDLIEAVDSWRRNRNEAVHAIVKSEPGEPTQPIESFLQKAKDAAEEGEKLTREVCNWCKKEKK